MLLEAIILGIVQGLTEFIPVSSSAHLILFPWFFGWKGEVDSLEFDVALHLGTLIALVIYFRKDIGELFSSLKEFKQYRYSTFLGDIKSLISLKGNERTPLLLILIACVPAGAAGLLFHDIIEEKLRDPRVIAFTLVAVAILMIIAERRFQKDRPFEKIHLIDSIVVGLAQSLALIPGVSRSGVTITAGLMSGIERQSAARFSFIISIPLIAAASLLEGIKMLKNVGNFDYQLFAVGLTTAAVTGYFTVKYLLLFFRKYSLEFFAYYRFVLAIIIGVQLWNN